MDFELQDVLSNAALVIAAIGGLLWAIVSTVEKQRAASGGGPGLDTLPERDGWRVPVVHAYERLVQQMPPREYGFVDQIAVDVRTPATVLFLSATAFLLVAGAAYMDGWSLVVGAAIGLYWLWQLPKMVKLVRYGLVREGDVLEVRGPTFFAQGVADVSIEDGGGPLTVVVPWRHCRRLLDEGPGARLLVVFHPKDRNNNLALAIRPKS